MRKLKKLLAVLMCMAMVVALAPGLTVSAEDSVIQSKIDALFALVGGNYFNVNRDGACGVGNYGHACDNCKNSNIVEAQWFKDMFGNISANQFADEYGEDVDYTRIGWSCLGFANFAEWYIFKDSDSDTVSTANMGSYNYNLENINNCAKIGDILRFDNSHSAIFIRADENGAYVLDSNYNIFNKGNCFVDEHYISFSSYKRFTVSRAVNYDNVQPDVPKVPDGLKYKVYDDHVEITNYTGNATELAIPAEIEGLPVTSIGYMAFYGCRSLVSVTIPDVMIP